MNPAQSLGGLMLAIAVAIVAASAVSRAGPDDPGASPTVRAELRASDLIGRLVRSPNGEAVGEIADLVLSPADKVSSVVVAVGGFLGIGERQVEVPFDTLVVAPDRSAVTMSSEQAEAIRDFPKGAHGQDEDEAPLQ
jgi:sporulation protein YlmC with PRC-barrel domain